MRGNEHGWMRGEIVHEKGSQATVPLGRDKTVLME